MRGHSIKEFAIDYSTSSDFNVRYSWLWDLQVQRKARGGLYLLGTILEGSNDWQTNLWGIMCCAPSLATHLTRFNSR